MVAIDATRLEWPTDWAARFGRSAPIGVEIGFGNGQFLIDLAQNHPEFDFVGIEISLPSIRKAEKKAKTLGLTNIQLVHGDARLFLWCGCRPELISWTTINFPDPWHKAAHHHRKLINPDFLHLLASRMVIGGRLDIATDDPGYQEVIRASLAETRFFASRLAEAYILSDPDRLQTKYELKALAEGRTPHYYHWQRNDAAAENRFPLPEVYEMPHVIIKTGLSLDEISSRYAAQPTESYPGKTPVRLLEMFQTIGAVDEERKSALLVETHIAEEPMPQRIGLTIQARPEQKVIIGLHELGFPRPTEGVHIAVAHLARWLLTADPNARLEHENLSVRI